MVRVVLGKEFYSFSVLGEGGTLSHIFKTPGAMAYLPRKKVKQPSALVCYLHREATGLAHVPVWDAQHAGITANRSTPAFVLFGVLQ